MGWIGRLVVHCLIETTEANIDLRDDEFSLTATAATKAYLPLTNFTAFW